VYVCVYVCACKWLHLCAQYRRRYRTGEKIERASMRSSAKLSLLAAHFALIDALSADWKRKSIEEAAYCFIRALQCDFRSFYSLAGERNPTSDRDKTNFSDLTIFVTSNSRVKSRLTVLIWKLTALHRAKLNYFCLEGDSALYFVSSIMFLHLCIDASRAISTTRAVIDM